jgi:hypothetical protein
MSAESRATLYSYFETADTPSQAEFANLIDSFYSLISDFKILFGTIDQSGTSAPTLTVFFNSLGFTPTFSYSSAGNYIMTSVGNLDVAKTVIFISTDQGSKYTPPVYSDTSPDSYEIDSLDNTGSAADDLLNNNSFLIIQIP